MPCSGALNRTFGVFRSLCCNAEIILGVGIEFPDCPYHPHALTDWRQIQAVAAADTTIVTCKERDELWDEWQTTVRAYSDAVKSNDPVDIPAPHSDRVWQVAQTARKIACEARDRLLAHIAEHGC